MEIQKILALISQGENSSIEFKSGNVRPESVAKEMAAFSNSFGGTLLIGVEDDGIISGINMEKIDQWLANIARNNVIPAISPDISIENIESKKVAVVEIPKGMNKPYQTIDGKYYIRISSTNRTATKEELSRLFQQAGIVHFDLSPVEGTEGKDLDLLKVNDYWSTCYDINFISLEKHEQQKILINSDIIVPFEGENVTSVGGLLLFGKQPQRRLPQSSIKTAIFKGEDITDDIIDKKEIIGVLPEIIDNTASLINIFLPRASIVKKLKREEQILIPVRVIREALVNAVSHRDYSIINRHTTVYIFSNRIEITSPGKIANTLTLEKIKVGNSAIRNHFLVKYLDNMRYIDGLGRGIPMIIKEMGERAIFEEIGELFRVTFLFCKA
ncbi:hypothetical protein BuS5_02755 [Desulfosarcina sp. BuS5]|uniref:RNA-binding domain-containing protein n=1 Tax=Desulfosarcina sp. BuS5 TaxID=933262 RepID=UPI00054D8854|nr:RNA-binding domain-containing protein [Desulfosarcina sp. BuS5]WDN89787.1 hypothetical protein BuS5_02755 [Desulfosarcina sp. BuS5]